MSPPSPSVAAPGLERYGRYYLIERIGRGGMAEVFRAVAQGAEGFRRVFVIKRIRPEKSDSAELIRMFCDEARLSALLHHPNIVQVYDFGQINGTYFLAMEYLRGKDLSGVMRAIRLAKSAVKPPIAAHIAHQVATALHYAHALTRMDAKSIRIVHRDVTPSNIMLQRTGAVKILDFGIAQATNFARQVETGVGRVKGKLAYLSPEQVRLQELDGRSDIFGLGVVLWEMLTGQRLFAGENEFLTMRNVLTQPVPAPSSRRAEVPAALDAIVARALERDRDQRYATAQEMADDLERFLQTTPCHSQALPRLLQELFGEESTDNTPDLPALADAESGHAFPLPSSAPSPSLPSPPSLPPEVILEIDAEPGVLPSDPLSRPSSSSRSSPSLPSLPVSMLQELPDRARLVRRIVSIAAAAALAACLIFALWRGRHPIDVKPRPPAVSNRAAALAKPEARPPEVPAAAADDPIAESETADSPAARGGKPAKKRATRRLSNDVTIDPFK